MKTLLFALIAPFLFTAPAEASMAEYRLEYRVHAPLRKLGTLARFNMTVYPEGIRGENLMLAGYWKAGEPSIVVMNKIARLYTELPVSRLDSTFRRLQSADEQVEAGNYGLESRPVTGKILGLPARRYRLLLGNDSWIDVWVTDAIPENRQLRHLSNQVITSLSGPAAPLLAKVPGTPLKVVVKSRRFDNAVLLDVRSVSFDGSDAERDLRRGRFYAAAPGALMRWLIGD